MAVYDTDTLTGMVRKVHPFEPFLLQMFFPNVITFPTKSISFDAIDEKLTLAPFVAPKVAGKVMTSEGGILKTFEPAYLKPKHVIEPDRVLQRQPGEDLGGSLSPMQRRDAIIGDNLVKERNSIQHRLEWMAAQALLLGTVTVEGEDYPTQVVDFGRDVGKTETLTGGASWDEVTATPVTDIETSAAELDAPATDVVMDQLAWGYLISGTHAEASRVEKITSNDFRGSTSTLNLDPDNGAYVQYKGSIGSMNIWVYSGYYHNSSGTRVNFIPANTVVIGSRAIDGVRAFGAILSPSAGYQAMEQYPRMWIDPNVEIEYTETQSAPLVIPKNANASKALTVI